jgi:UDP-N-acetylglucosamine 4,6-dehydratase/5-epimerase
MMTMPESNERPYLYGKAILITGGTGSFGKAFVGHALTNLNPTRLVVLSRDELKQWEMNQLFDHDERLRFFIGDVRDQARLERAFHGIDAVIHAAALKQIVTAEYNPSEYIHTNILGSENVINAAINTGVERVIGLSTDKASSPVNLYGATKLAADKLFSAANHYAAGGPTRFAVVRYGNVEGSRGSVVPYFKQLAPTGTLPITDVRMTRFWITLEQATRFVQESFDWMVGGELFVPKIPSVRIVDIARAIAPAAELVEVGIRPGEKLHEEMVSEDDARRTVEMDRCYIILPVYSQWGAEFKDGNPVPEGFSYRSHTNTEWLEGDGLKELVRDQ